MAYSGKGYQLRNLEAIAAVLALSRTGSFRAAMRETGQGFRTLSNSLESFEKQLGFPVFRRTSNGLIATSEGQAVILEAQRIEETLTRLERLATQSLATTPSELVIGVSEGIGIFWLLPRLRAFEIANPLIRLRLDTNGLMSDPRHVDADVYLQYHDPDIPTMVRVRFTTIHLVLCASRTYLARFGNPKSLDELASHRFVVQVGPNFSHAALLADRLNGNVPYGQTTSLTSSSAHYLTIERGAGIGFLPSFMLQISSTIMPVALRTHESLDFWLSYQQGGRQNSRLNETLGWLRTLFDPRVNPWFRRDFIDPQKFDGMIASGEIPAIDEAFRFGCRG